MTCRFCGHLEYHLLHEGLNKKGKDVQWVQCDHPGCKCRRFQV